MLYHPAKVPSMSSTLSLDLSSMYCDIIIAFILRSVLTLTVRFKKMHCAQLIEHSALMRNLMKVWKTWTGPSRGGRAWSRGPKSALSEILQNKEHFY